MSLDEAGRIKIVAGLDTFVAILLLLAGILITILGIDYVNMTSGYSGYDPFSAVGVSPWIPLVFGLATIIYGIKRMVDDILKILTIES